MTTPRPGRPAGREASGEEGARAASAEAERLCTHRLVFAKRMYLHGVEHSNHKDPFSQALALHHFHAAAETTLKAVLLQRNVADSELNLTFGALLKKVAGLPPHTLPLQSEMLKLNNLRNLVQHHNYQPAEQVEAQRYFARSFLEQVFEQYLGRSFLQLSVADDVTFSTVRASLKEAEQHLAQGNYESAYIACWIAFEDAMHVITKPADPERFSLSDKHDEFLGDIIQEIAYAHEIVAILCLNIDYWRYLRFKEGISLHVSWDGLTRSYIVHVPTDTEWTEADVWDLYGFVTTAVFQWQDMGLFPEEPYDRYAARWGRPGQNWRDTRRIDYTPPATDEPGEVCEQTDSGEGQPQEPDAADEEPGDAAAGTSS